MQESEATADGLSTLREAAVEHFEQTPEVEVDDLALDDVVLYRNEAEETFAVAPNGTGAELVITEDGVTATPAIIETDDETVEQITITDQRERPSVDKLDEESLRDPSKYD